MWAIQLSPIDAGSSLSLAVTHGNESWTTNSPRDSSVSVGSNYSCAMYTNHGYYSRAAFISLEAPDCAATI